MQRRNSTVAALALAALGAPSLVAAQTRAAPGPDTPRLLVAVFQSSDRAAGVQAADAIRTRITNGTNVRQLYVIPRTDITNYLESSGYKPDSSLGPSDLKELAKLLRADEVLFGTVTRTPSGVRIEPRLLLARDVSLAQPLPAADAANPNDAARLIERTYQDARRQLADNKACENHIRAQEFDKAIAAANAGITKYPQATLARLCLASAYQAMKLPADSVLRVVEEIRRIDPKNSFALRLAYGAYSEKQDQENAVRALVQLLALEPTNQTLQGQVVSELAKLGKPAIAIPIVDTLLLQNPGDPQLIRQKWLLLFAAAASDSGEARMRYLEQGLTTGEEMARLDTTLADSTFYSRQVAAASGLTNNPQRAVEYASRAVQRYPNSADFWAMKGNAERKAGQLQIAQQSLNRALSINPQYPNGSLLLAQIYLEMNQVDSAVAVDLVHLEIDLGEQQAAQIYLEMNQVDSAVAVARRAVASGAEAATWGAFLLAPTQAAFKAAQESKAVEDYERALALAEESDKLSQSATAKFFKGVASFQIGIDAIQKAQRPKSCPLARRAQEMFVVTQTNMPGGGSVDAATAQQILGYVGQYAPVADQMVKQYCK